ncbi:flagellar hook-length control protein FliK [Aurantimonas sp. VKM B-3413]|uniref:flagellar hook-length control protein FliK n=1 Tax=Aurantimonas sp. VKM B-3413 TaxID=2779401 RepID=UPI001E4AC16D|nr:flagellar hook-length control protein FliK [Aurantimonas sp. VKM B-3413]MCB8838136.1 flagellar hook-length control protein FliK [Aurantimonas sp. VKM B-3413]
MTTSPSIAALNAPSRPVQSGSAGASQKTSGSDDDFSQFVAAAGDAKEGSTPGKAKKDAAKADEEKTTSTDESATAKEAHRSGKGRSESMPASLAALLSIGDDDETADAAEEGGSSSKSGTKATADGSAGVSVAALSAAAGLALAATGRNASPETAQAANATGANMATRNGSGPVADLKLEGLETTSAETGDEAGATTGKSGNAAQGATGAAADGKAPHATADTAPSAVDVTRRLPSAAAAEDRTPKGRVDLVSMRTDFQPAGLRSGADADEASADGSGDTSIGKAANGARSALADQIAALGREEAGSHDLDADGGAADTKNGLLKADVSAADIGAPVSRQLSGALGRTLPSIVPQGPGAPAERLRLQAGGAALKTIQIQLQPESLGTVDVTMRMVGGALAVHLEASRPEAALALKDDTNGLKKLLNKAGFSVDDAAISISVRDPGNLRSNPGANAGAGQADGGAGGTSGGGAGASAGQNAASQNGGGAQGGGEQRGRMPAGADPADRSENRSRRSELDPTIYI